MLALLLTGSGRVFGAEAEDPRVHIVTPIAGQQFAPGDKVSIVVEVAPSLHATDGGVSLRGLGILKVTGFPSTRFEASFVIPDYFAGPLTIEPEAQAAQAVFGSPVTIKVRPVTPPESLYIGDRNYFVSLPQRYPEEISVRGLYAGGLERDLSSSASGTTYTSSNPAVVTVDRDGTWTLVGNGLAVVTIENGGVRNYVMFEVDDPAHPTPPIDVTDRVAIRRGSLRAATRNPAFFNTIQQITVTNTTALPLGGPMFLSITDLPQGVSCEDTTRQLELPDEGLNLLPGQSVTAQFSFYRRGNEPIQFKARVYHGKEP